MARVPDVPRGTVDVEGDGDAVEVRIDAAPPDAGPNEHGVATLADVVVRGLAGGVAIIRVRGTDDFHYAAIVVRAGIAELVHLEWDGDAFAAAIAVSAGEIVHLTVVASDFETGMAWLEHVVAAGGMGMGGEAEMTESPPPPPPPLPQIDTGGGRGVEEAVPLPPVLEAVEPIAPAPGGPAATIAHIDAEMPARAVQREEVAVRVRLSREALAPTPGAAHDDAVISVDPSRAVTVTVMPRGLMFRRGAHATRTLRLPEAGRAPAIAEFRLVAVDPGPVEVSVIVRQDPFDLPLATLRLTAEVTSGARRRGTPRPRRGRAPVGGRPAELAGLPTIRVDESIAGGRSTLRVRAAVGGESAEFRADLGDKSRFIDKLYGQLRGIRAHLEGFPADRRAMEAEAALADIGGWLAGRVFGDEVRALLLRHRDALDGLIVQTSAEVDIPWEIVCIASPPARPVFLADTGLVRFVYDTAHPRLLTIAPDRVLTVSPVYVDEALQLERTKDEIAALSAHFAAVPTALDSRDQITTGVTGGFDLLHFAGHGRWRAADPAGQELLLSTFSEQLAPDGSSYAEFDARRDMPQRVITDPETPGPFVFLSACDVGRLQSGATGLGGFAEAFLRGGAGAFIGCSWAVRDDIASRFVAEFYRAAFDDGLPLAQATLAARTACRNAGELSALAFTVFADPRARLVTA